MTRRPGPSDNVFGGSPLDRAHDRREDEAFLRRVLDADDTVVVPVRRREALVTAGDDPSAVLLRIRDLSPESSPEEGWAFLGVRDGTPYLAIDVDEWPEEDVAALVPEPVTWAELHGIGALLDEREASILAYARAMVTWHRRGRHCGRCGGAMRTVSGGHVRRCAQCGESDFPRTDPAVIVFVHEGDGCLLGRQEAWPAGLYSTFAGFVEPGESLEACVRRELREEADVDLATLDYHSSQPWPFPSSVMIGFTATTSGRPRPRAGPELEAVRWFERRELEAGMVADELRLPPEVSIARRMIDEWRRV